MTTSTIDLQNEAVIRLKELANKAGAAPEDLLRASIEQRSTILRMTLLMRQYPF